MNPARLVRTSTISGHLCRSPQRMGNALRVKCLSSV
jgi:hypothetical protein